MNLRLLLLLILVIQVNGDKKCFSPVTCSENGRSGLEWIQIYPSPGCKLSGNGNWSDAKVIRGEKGSQGPAGPPGEQGPPGIANKTITDELEDKTARLQAEMATLIANHSLEKQVLRKLLNQSTDDNTKLRKDLESSEMGLKDLINSLQISFDQAVADIKSNAVKQSQQTASEIDQLQREIATLRASHSSEKQTLRKLLNQSMDDNTKLKRELESLETEIKNLINSQQSAIDQAATDINSNDIKQSQQTNTIANEIDQLQREITTLRTSHSSEKLRTQKLLNQATDDNTKLSKELDSLETETKNLIKSQQIAINRAVADIKSYDVKQSTQANAITTLQEGILFIQNRFHTDVECKIVHSGKCFWVSSEPHSANTGKKFCADRGGALANIYSSIHFEKLRRYISSISRDDDDYVTGMTYNGTSIKLSDRTAAPFVNWISRAPYSGSGKTAMMFESFADSETAGIWNNSPSGKQEGVICEKPL